MLAIRTDDKEAEISGTADDLRKIRVGVVSLLSSTENSASFKTAPSDPAPYPRALSELIVQRALGLTLVTVTQTALVVVGSDDSLARFSSWFNLPAEAQAGNHMHFEPMPDDAYHSSESVPLVIAID